MCTLYLFYVSEINIDLSASMHSIDNVDYSYLFEINNTTTRGHRLKLKKQFCKTNCRKFSFSQRVINDWNSFSPE